MKAITVLCRGHAMANHADQLVILLKPMAYSSHHSRSSEQDEGEDVDLFIQFDYTACHYGNQRTWLLCPHCHKRVAIIYSEGKYFLCRKCSNLTLNLSVYNATKDSKRWHKEFARS
jgi:hypothetical protein